MQIFEGTIIHDSDNNDYKVLDLIGRGGFGDVYKIQCKEKFYALKTIRSNLFDEKDYKSFVNEAKSAIGISHKNVIKYIYFHDGFLFNNLPPYIIMELAPDGSLREYLKSNIEFLSNPELTEIYFQLIDGMSEISTKFVHRDLKPENILLSGNDFKITDFGLTKLINSTTRHTTFKGWGSYPYFAPESWKFEKNTHKMDIYALGIIFYELATKKHPLIVANGTMEQWQEAHLFQIPESPDKINSGLTPNLTRTILKMISKKPTDRFNNWEEIKKAFEKEFLPKTDDTPIINSILQRKNEAKQKALEIKTKQEKRENEITTFRNIISYQLENEIIKPLNEFIEQYNSLSDSEEFKLVKGSHNLHYTISTGYSKPIKIELEAILEENFWREVEIKDFGQRLRRNKLIMPKYNDNPIMAWGFIESNEGYGLNLLLVKNNEAEIYGNWIVLFNRNSTLNTNRRRIEPFAYKFGELEDAIPSLRSLGFYVSEVHDLGLDKIKEFVSKFM